MSSFIKLLLIFSIFLSITNSEGIIDNKSLNKEPSAEIAKIQDSNESNSTCNTDKELTGVVEIPSLNIRYGTPDMRYETNGYIDMYIEDNDKYIVFVTDNYCETHNSPKDVFNCTFPLFVDGVSKFNHLNELGEITERNLTINGTDVYVFEGTISSGLDKKCDQYIKGFTFIFKGVPCAIYGVVMDEDQPQHDIDYISEVISKMMKSIRNT